MTQLCVALGSENKNIYVLTENNDYRFFSRIILCLIHSTQNVFQT